MFSVACFSSGIYSSPFCPHADSANMTNKNINSLFSCIMRREFMPSFQGFQSTDFLTKKALYKMYGGFTKFFVQYADYLLDRFRELLFLPGFLPDCRGFLIFSRTRGFGLMSSAGVTISEGILWPIYSSISCNE